MFKLKIVLMVSLALFAVAQGAPVLFEGSDFGVNYIQPRPNSDAAASAFDAAANLIGDVSIIDFEAFDIGYFDNLAIAPGVNLSATDLDYASGIRTNSGTLYGYNTTADGNRFFQLVQEDMANDNDIMSLVFDFDDPVSGFGMYVTGLGITNGNLLILFDDGSMQDVEIGGDVTGGVKFFGFTDEGATIDQITLQMVDIPGDGNRDNFGIDDIRIVRGAVSDVPEPSVFLLTCIGLASLTVLRRKSR